MTVADEAASEEPAGPPDSAPSSADDRPSRRDRVELAVRAVARWALQPESRWFMLAVLVGLLLRLAWATWATQATLHPRADTGRYLTAAVQLASGSTPYDIEGDPTAANAIGYPALLSPFFWVVGKAGSPSYVYTAALVNVVLATMSVVFAGLLASAWIGRAARTPAAWLLALAAPHIYFTSPAMTETCFVTGVLGGLLAATWLTDAGRRPRRWQWGAYGVLVGFVALVNPGGIVLLLAPALCRRARSGTWRAAATGIGVAVLASLLLLVPAGLRNGVEVGIWTPFPSSNAMAVCMGHRDGADGTAAPDDRAISECFTHEDPAPGETSEEAWARWLASDPDERDWYYTNVRTAAGWAVTHPAEEVRLSILKVWVTMKTSNEALGTAEDNGSQPLTDGHSKDALLAAGELWHHAVLALAALALVGVPRCRRALPLWATAAMLVAGLLVVHGSSRYNHTIMALLAVLASGAVAALFAGGAALGDDAATDSSDDAGSMAPTPPTTPAS